MATANISITRNNGSSLNIAGDIPDTVAAAIAQTLTDAITASLTAQVEP